MLLWLDYKEYLVFINRKMELNTFLNDLGIIFSHINKSKLPWIKISHFQDMIEVFQHKKRA